MLWSKSNQNKEYARERYFEKKNNNCKNLTVIYKCNNFIENDRNNENH
jgi:hypothetical protein